MGTIPGLSPVGSHRFHRSHLRGPLSVPAISGVTRLSRLGGHVNQLLDFLGRSNVLPRARQLSNLFSFISRGWVICGLVGLDINKGWFHSTNSRKDNLPIENRLHSPIMIMGYGQHRRGEFNDDIRTRLTGLPPLRLLPVVILDIDRVAMEGEG